MNWTASICETTSLMDKIRITGNGPLNGEIEISGAKNAALPLMCAAMTDQPLVQRSACPICAMSPPSMNFLHSSA